MGKNAITERLTRRKLWRCEKKWRKEGKLQKTDVLKEELKISDDKGRK